MGASPAPVLTSFEGGRALSDFRAVGLLRRLRDRVPTITGVTARHVHWVASATPLDADTHTRVAQMRHQPDHAGRQDNDQGACSRGGRWLTQEIDQRRDRQDGTAPAKTAQSQSDEQTHRYDPKPGHPIPSLDDVTPGGIFVRRFQANPSGAHVIFTQYYLDCLSQASYLIADEGTGQAIVVDPRRDVEDYLADAQERGLQIVGVIDTHFHADFIAGHHEVAKATGAWIGFGEAANADFPIRKLADGERISLGEVTLEVMATPGHTPESISILVYEHADDEVAYGVLTGDALFIGDVGRPDLLASVGVTADELGRMLYDSVQRKLMSLPDQVRVFPAHGAGSACGKNLSTEKQSTIGEQRRFNYACQPMSEEKFVAVVTEGQPSAPAYFIYNATLNKQQHGIRDLDSTVPALSFAEVDQARAAGAAIHDARSAQEFSTSYLMGSINVPSDGRMAETVGMVLEPTTPVVLIAPEGQEQEVAMRFARIGFDNVLGYIEDPEGYFLAHQDQVRRASRLTVQQAREAMADHPVQVIDIRNPGEVSASAMIPGARNIPLAELARRSSELDPNTPVLLNCAGGWRSSVGASLLRSKGFVDVSDLLGGYGAWEQAESA